MFWVGFNLFFFSDSETTVFWNLLLCSLLYRWPWQCIPCVPRCERCFPVVCLWRQFSWKCS